MLKRREHQKPKFTRLKLRCASSVCHFGEALKRSVTKHTYLAWIVWKRRPYWLHRHMPAARIASMLHSNCDSALRIWMLIALRPCLARKWRLRWKKRDRKTEIWWEICHDKCVGRLFYWQKNNEAKEEEKEETLLISLLLLAGLSANTL